MKKTSIFYLIFFSAVFLSCKNNEEDCSGEFVCTTEFRIISVEVVNSGGNPVVFDEYTVTNLTTNEVVDLDWESGDYYPIADDSMNEIPVEGHTFELVGIIDGVEVVRENYLIGRDCCHILLLEGNTMIQL